MTELIFENLTYIGYAAALLATVWLANFLLEIYYTRVVAQNCKSLRECLSGAARFFAVCAGVTLLTVAISAFPAVPYGSWTNRAGRICRSNVCAGDNRAFRKKHL